MLGLLTNIPKANRADIFCPILTNHLSKNKVHFRHEN